MGKSRRLPLRLSRFAFRDISAESHGRCLSSMAVSKPNLIRLLSAVLGAATSVWFAVTYSRFSKFRFEFEPRGGILTNATTEMLAYGQWLFLLPVTALVLGVWLLFARPRAVATFEFVLCVTWLLALTIALCCILIWQAQNVPVFSHMEWHY